MKSHLKNFIRNIFKKSFTGLFLFFLLVGWLSGKQKNVQYSSSISSTSNLVVTYLDVRQGDSTVIKTPQGKIYVIDTGLNDKSYGGKFDAGEDVIIPFLESRKASFINGLIITHPHLDHYGGNLAILDKFKVLEYIDSGWPTKSPIYLQILKKVDEKKIPYKIVKEGDKLDWEYPLKIEIFGPRTQTYDPDPEKENPNNRSIILKLTYRTIAFLFTGDAEIEVEDHLVETFGSKLESHILKIGHHGSKTSSSEEFLRTVKPEIGIISCGRRNRFKCPYPSTLYRLKELGIRYYRTDEEGTIQVITDGKSYTVKTFGVGQSPAIPLDSSIKMKKKEDRK